MPSKIAPGDAELVRSVAKPIRYVGGEWNAVKKDLANVRVKFAFAYPDTYEVGMSHLGLQILYHVLNQRDDTACERVFSPWPDMADLLRSRGDALHSLESRLPLSEFDIVGVTLQHELNYTNILSLLDLGGVPIRAADREAGGPLVIAGGPCAVNPEPLAYFFDAFVIGEGEEVVHEIIDAYVAWQDGGGSSRDELLARLAQIAGVYVPSLYEERTLEGGGIERRAAGAAKNGAAPERIVRRIVEDLDAAPFPTAPVVPFSEAVHDRGMLEIMRGCPRGCRFCQARAMYRPARSRSLETLKEQTQALLANTGYEEIAPLALNCSDYPHMAELLEYLATVLGDRPLSVSLPSLRPSVASVELADRAYKGKRTGLTFAPEAGSERLRRAINKPATDEEILATARAAFEAGWTRLKLYFMVGLPGESDDDVKGIAELAHAVERVGDEVLGSRRRGRLGVSLSVNFHIPKPHTPLQWSRQISAAEVAAKLDILKENIRSRRIKLRWANPSQSLLEGTLSRGGRELCEVLQRAHAAGCSFDAWGEHLQYGAWESAFRECGMDLEEYATAEWRVDAPLPWDHIDCGVTRESLLAARQKAYEE
ncbi:MAG: TIGR03960 family B12-binding radical SAM protein [Armatimonadota bacterium]